jgi:hypothetical protein
MSQPVKDDQPPNVVAPGGFDRVTRIKLQNFKAIGEPFELELLTPLTVLIGANSSGVTVQGWG